MGIVNLQEQIQCRYEWIFFSVKNRKLLKGHKIKTRFISVLTESPLYVFLALCYSPCPRESTVGVPMDTHVTSVLRQVLMEE